MAESSFVEGEQVTPSPGSESPTSNTMQLDRALRHCHALEKASSQNVSLSGLPTVISSVVAYVV